MFFYIFFFIIFSLFFFIFYFIFFYSRFPTKVYYLYHIRGSRWKGYIFNFFFKTTRESGLVSLSKLEG